jgi:hypothetical protein
MKIKTYIEYAYESEFGELEVPLEFDEDSVMIEKVGNKVIMGCLVRDEYPGDPLEEFDEGKLVVFDNSVVHSAARPEVGDFKRIIRDNPGRVFFVHSRHNDGYFVAGPGLTVADTKGEGCRAEEIEDVDGYYIVPEDATDFEKYAKGVMETYTSWCVGDVWGIAIWQWDADTLEFDEDSRESECWGFYGYEYAVEELKLNFKSEVDNA